ncbi:MAG TPA: flagellar hook-length control protein FliK [Deltaproteobacteria bacterium]|nr:flagellar hook-length control protein FliK [Deltaproteobacteria bacterium]
MAGQIYDIIRSMIFDSTGLLKAGTADTRRSFNADFGDSLREAAEKALNGGNGLILKKHDPDGAAIMSRKDIPGNRGEAVASTPSVNAAGDMPDGFEAAVSALATMFDEGDAQIKALVKNGAFFRVTDGVVKLYLPGRDRELMIASSDGKQLHLVRSETMQAGRALLFEKAPGKGDGQSSTIQAVLSSAGSVAGEDNPSENDILAKHGARIRQDHAKPVDFPTVSKLFAREQGPLSKTSVTPGSGTSSGDVVLKETTVTVTDSGIPGGRGVASAVTATTVMPGSTGDVNNSREIMSAKNDATVSQSLLEPADPTAASKLSSREQASPSKTPVVPGSEAATRDIVLKETTITVVGGRTPGGRGVASAGADVPVFNGSPGDVERALKGGVSTGEAVERSNDASAHRHLFRPVNMSVSRDAPPAGTVDGAVNRPEGWEHYFQRQVSGNNPGDGKTAPGARDEQSFAQRARIDIKGERLSPATQAKPGPAEFQMVERSREANSSAVRGTTAGFSGGEDAAVENKQARWIGEIAGNRELPAGAFRVTLLEKNRSFRGGDDGKTSTAGVDGPGSTGENQRGFAAARTSPDIKVIGSHLSSMAASQGKEGSRRMRLQLQPPHLGSLNMEVIVRDKMVRVLLRVDSSEAGRFLQASTEQLKGALQEQGFTVDSFSVTQRDQEAGFGRYEERGGTPFEGESGEENGRNGERTLPEPGQDEHIGRFSDGGHSAGRLSFFV